MKQAASINGSLLNYRSSYAENKAIFNCWLNKNPDPSLKKVKVRTDGMLSEVGYSHPHPFGLNNEVLVDL
jgi:hypothetical protein